MKSEDKIIDKIKKLLALSKSANEEEASSALLKAQELMAKYDLDVQESDVPIEYSKELCNSKWNMGFRRPLASVLAPNFRCKHYLHGSSIVFMGHKVDAKIAKEVFEFAYNFALSGGNKMYNKCYNSGQETKGVFNSYTLGFIEGIKIKLAQQCEALMIIVPPDVKDKYDDMAKGWKTYGGAGMQVDNINSEAFKEGVRDGKQVLDARKITA